MSKKKRLTVPPGHVLVFRPYRTDKSGRRIYAKWFGFRAWPMIVPITK